MSKKIFIPVLISVLIASLLYACVKMISGTPSAPGAPKASIAVYSKDPYTFGNNILNELKNRGNNLDYSKNNYEDKQESNFVRKNGIYVSKGSDGRNNMFLVYKIPKDFTKDNYDKLKADYTDILESEYNEFKNEYSRINMNIQDAPGNETKKNGFLFYNVQTKELYLDKTDGI